jgi:hypothetical protein
MNHRVFSKQLVTGGAPMGIRVAAALLPVPLVLFMATGFEYNKTSTDVVGVNVDALPALAQELLPMVETERLNACPDIPLIWLLAHVQAESSWNPRAYSYAGAAGLLQFMPGTWAEAGGGSAWATAVGPPDEHPVWQPQPHMRVALPWMCANLRMVTAHIQATGKPTAPLVAMAVCHIAGCSRVTGSATGIPAPGEAGCGTECSRQIQDYIDTIERWIQAWAAPVTLPASNGGTAQAYAGGDTGCVIPDPTGTGGCVTGATAWMLTQAQAAFPDIPVACYRPATWGEHGIGRACDFVIGRIGAFPNPALTQRGWEFARWLQDNAGPLNIQYLIWHGRIWSVARNAEGWRVYNGAGVYDTTEPTGGHYDHVHVSVTH